MRVLGGVSEVAWVVDWVVGWLVGWWVGWLVVGEKLISPSSGASCLRRLFGQLFRFGVVGFIAYPPVLTWKLPSATFGWHLFDCWVFG